MNKNTKIITLVAVVVVALIGVVAFAFLGNPKTEEDYFAENNVDVTEETDSEKISESEDDTQDEVTMPGVSAVDSSMLPSITRDDINTMLDNLEADSKKAEYSYSEDWTLDEALISGNMQWALVYQNTFYVVASSVIAQYADDNNLDPYAFEPEVWSDPEELINGYYGMTFSNGSIDLVIAAEMDSRDADGGLSFLGYLYEVRSAVNEEG